MSIAAVPVDVWFPTLYIVVFGTRACTRPSSEYRRAAGGRRGFMLAKSCNDFRNSGDQEATNADRHERKSPPIHKRDQRASCRLRLGGARSIQLSYGDSVVDSLSNAEIAESPNLPCRSLFITAARVDGFPQQIYAAHRSLDIRARNERDGPRSAASCDLRMVDGIQRPLGGISAP